MIKCEFCYKEYSTKGNLLKHQQSTKKCKSIQNTIKKCLYCEYKSNILHDYDIHIQSCKENTKRQLHYSKLKSTNLKLKEQNNKLQIELEVKNKHILFIEQEYHELKQQIKENFNTLIKNPSFITNSNTSNTTNNNQKLELAVNLKSDFIQQNVDDNFMLHHLVDGIKGFAKFTSDFIVHKENGQSKYICSDTSRTIFKYKDENGHIQKDVKAMKLKNVMKNPIITKSKLLYNDESSRLLDKLSNDNNINNRELTNLHINTLTDQFLKIKHIDDYSDEYAKEMMLMLN